MSLGTAGAVRTRLRKLANPDKARVLQGFFRTGPGEYGEGDVFLGIQVPTLRAVAQLGRDLPLADIESLLVSPIHEERLLALLILVHRFGRSDERGQKAIFRFYLGHTRHINNWDLVDLSAPNIVGAFLQGRSRAPLRRLARSRNLWERRIAIVATHAFIRNGEFGPTFETARRLLSDHHDLIHKATGWMLREIGKRGPAALREFLGKHAQSMPRTMLRYAIERFPEEERQRYLKGTA